MSHVGPLVEWLCPTILSEYDGGDDGSDSSAFVALGTLCESVECQAGDLEMEMEEEAEAVSAGVGGLESR
jgi:hypothetical protein